MLFDLDQGNHKNKQPSYLISIGKSCAEYNSAQHCAVESWSVVKV